jgi:hypothetical protein
MRERTKILFIAFLVATGLFAATRRAEAQVCMYYTWSTWPDCNVPCIYTTCKFCET